MFLDVFVNQGEEKGSCGKISFKLTTNFFWGGINTVHTPFKNYVLFRYSDYCWDSFKKIQIKRGSIAKKDWSRRLIWVQKRSEQS